METICAVLVFLGINLSMCSAAATLPCVAFWGAQPITGVHTSVDVCRYTVKYGEAGRWEDSVAVTTQLGINASAFPPVCPQFSSPTNAGAAQDEDCLYAIVYAPILRPRHPLPVFVWLHGGSYVDGSASAPGVEGTRLASQGNVVVIPQYRQGVLGLLPPAVAPTSADPNLAVRDIVLLLQTVSSRILGFGGDCGQVTLGGQSTGATYIRTLWATPSAVGLFHRMVLQSDGLMYGLQSTETLAIVQQIFKNHVCPNCTTLADFRAIPVSSIIASQNNISVESFITRPGVPLSGAYRPTYGTPTTPHESITALYNDPGLLSISPNEVPLLISTVKDEGDAAVYKLWKAMIAPTDHGTVFGLYKFILGMSRATIMTTATDYAPSPTTTDGRDVLSKAFTDGTFRCASRALANKYAAAGGRAYVGEFRQGTTYVTNAAVPYCNGKVCHEDDLFPTFGTTGDETFLGQINTLWSNFIKTGIPEASWQPFEANTGVVGDRVRALGGDNFVPSCPANFWGSTLQWDWQVYI